MLKEFVEKLIDLANPEIYEINGDTYTTNQKLVRVPEYIDRLKRIDFSSLDGIVQAIRVEIERNEIFEPLFITILSPSDVIVFTTLRDDLDRDYLYRAAPDLPRPFEKWSDHDDAIIMLRSQFVPNEDVDYLLDLCSRISSNDSVKSEDNGVTQEVSVTAGVALRKYEIAKSRVSLMPFRTFLEVAQPESEFILRVKAGNIELGKQPQIGIIEADGGAWKLQAKKNIAEYFRDNLSPLVEKGRVIITE